MNITIGLNKNFSTWWLGLKLARILAPMGYLTTFMSEGNTKYFCGEVAHKNYGSLTRAKTIASQLRKTKTQLIISLMNTKICEAALEAKIPYVYVEDEYYRTKRFTKIEKQILEKALQVIILHGEGNVKFIKKYVGYGAEAILRPAISVRHCLGEKPHCFKKPNNILAVTDNFEKNKKNGMLEVWKYLSSLHPTWHLTLIASTNEKDDYQKYIDKHALANSTEIVTENENIEQLISHADIFAFLVTKQEKMPIFLNAMASKLPCVAFPTQLTKQVITEDINGKLVSNEQELTVALDALMVDWGKRVGLAIAAEKLKDHYPIQSFVDAIVNIAHTIEK